MSYIESWKASISACENEPPLGYLQTICMWFTRFRLILSLIVGIWSLDFIHISEYLSALMFGVTIIAWATVEILTRRVDWEDASRLRWMGLILIGAASLGVAAFNYVTPNSDRGHLLHGFMYQTTAANLPSTEIRMLALKHDGGPYNMWHGSLWVTHGEESSTITMSFPSANACRSLLAKFTPPTTRLSHVELGQETFNGWPRKEMLHEHCAEDVKLVYATNTGVHHEDGSCRIH